RLLYGFNDRVKLSVGKVLMDRQGQASGGHPSRNRGSVGDDLWMLAVTVVVVYDLRVVHAVANSLGAQSFGEHVATDRRGLVKQHSVLMPDMGAPRKLGRGSHSA